MTISVEIAYEIGWTELQTRVLPHGYLCMSSEVGYPVFWHNISHLLRRTDYSVHSKMTCSAGLPSRNKIMENCDMVSSRKMQYAFDHH